MTQDDTTDLSVLNCYLVSGESTDVDARVRSQGVLEGHEMNQDYAGVLKSMLFCSHWKAIKKFVAKQFASIKKAQGPLNVISKMSTALLKYNNLNSIVPPDEASRIKAQFIDILQMTREIQVPATEVEALTAVMTMEASVSAAASQKIEHIAVDLLACLESEMNTPEEELSTAMSICRGRTQIGLFFAERISLLMRNFIDDDMNKCISNI